MLNGVRSKIKQQKRWIGLKGGINKRSPLILLSLVLIWSILLGWGMAEAMAVSHSPNHPKTEITQLENLVAQNSAVPSKYQLGQELYLENCSSCHIAIPPEVFPTATWRQLLQDKQHYGVQLQTIIGPTLLLMWDYIRTFSRPETQKESIPYRVSESRYFKALHPKVDLPRNLKIATCISCHPGTPEFNFRRLTPEWENSP